MVLQEKVKALTKTTKTKNKIGIVVDDVCSLPKDIVDRNKIEVVETRFSLKEKRKFRRKIFMR